MVPSPCGAELCCVQALGRPRGPFSALISKQGFKTPTFSLLSSGDMPSGALCCPWVKTPLTTMALRPRQAPLPPLPYPHLLLTSALSMVLHREVQSELSAVTAGLCMLRTAHIWGQRLLSRGLSCVL